MIYVALLRGINVIGRNRIVMAELRAMFEALGFAGAKRCCRAATSYSRVEHKQLVRWRRGWKPRPRGASA
jgi:hypothetical protein